MDTPTSPPVPAESRPSESPPIPAPDRESERLALETDKLVLEIESLRKKNQRDIVRLLTIIVAVAGLLFGCYKFYGEQQKETSARAAEERLRLQNQLRTDVDEILRFQKDKTVSRVAFLLEDLSTTLDSKSSKGQTVGDMFPGYRRAFTKKLVYLISYDCDFVWSRKEVDLAEVTLEQWKDYGEFLKQDHNKLGFILHEHVRALRYLRDKNPGYFEKMRYEAKTDEYIVRPKYEKQDGEEERFQHFSDIRDGFLEHLKLIAVNPTPEAKEIGGRYQRQFEGALCNRRIAKAIFRKSFVDEPCEE